MPPVPYWINAVQKEGKRERKESASQKEGKCERCGAGCDHRQTVPLLVDCGLPEVVIAPPYDSLDVQTTSDPGRAYSATPADRGPTRSSRFFGVWLKNTSAELLYDVLVVSW